MKIILLTFLLSSCSLTAIKCFKECGIYPDGCMSSCKAKAKVEKKCGKDNYIFNNRYHWKCLDEKL